MNVALWLYSWFMGRLPVLLAVGAVVAGVWGYGHTRHRAGVAATEARWAARVEAARVDAAKVNAAQTAAVVASNGALRDAQAKIAALDHALGVSVDSLRKFAARPRNLPAPADYPRCVAELAAERDRAGAVDDLLVRGSDLARALAAERDDAVARLHAAADAWPR